MKLAFHSRPRNPLHAVENPTLHLPALSGNLRNRMSGALLLSLLAAAPATAVDIAVTWNWFMGGIWSNKNFWSPVVVPSEGYIVGIGGPAADYNTPGVEIQVDLGLFDAQCKRLMLGFANGYIGTLGVGTQTLTVAEGIVVGDTGQGKLLVAGPLFPGSVISRGENHIGKSAGGEGEASIAGSWTIADDSTTYPTTYGSLNVGQSGRGTLNVWNGGSVTSRYGYVGRDSNGTGAVTISGAGSKWTVSSIVYPNGSNGGIALIVGFAGNGTINIQEGGRVDSYHGSLGRYISGRGEALITGAGSEWATDSFEIGGYGSGALNVRNAGKVTCSRGYIGTYTGGNGTANVSGAGSEWINNIRLDVGYVGNGILTIDDGGTVTAPQTQLGAGSSSITGAANLLGVPDHRGVLETAALSGSNRANSVLTFNGGVLRGRNGLAVSGFQDGKIQIQSGGAYIDTQNSDGYIASSIGGVGGLTKLGSGELDLSGNNTYTGETVVAEGSLRFDGGLQGGVTVNAAGTLYGAGIIHGDATIAGKLVLNYDSLQVENCTWSGSTDGSATMRLGLGDSDSGQLVADQAFLKGGANTYCFDFANSGPPLGATKTYVLVRFGNTTFDASDFSYINLSPGCAGTFEIAGRELLFHVTAPPVIAIDTSLDTNGLTWSSGGDSPWTGGSAMTHDGTDAAQSGTIGHSQESWMETTVTGPGTLSYWWKVSSEGSYDWLEFYLDGALQSGRISGMVDWTQKTYTIGSGSHTLRWRYSKDSSAVAGSDAGWVDQVVWTPTDPYNSWAVTVFTPAQLANPAISGATADPDKDGLVNLLECLLGGQPLTGNANLQPTLTTTPVAGGRNLVFRYRRKLAAAGITQVVESAPDFSSPWTPAVHGQNGVIFATSPVDAATEQVTVTIPTAGPKAFVRLRASR